ncbi:hypothetical protein [Butyricicoccus sp. Marseille-Q5471]|uniref:hypothetical protein n=1 Tax=Butyricicoccus sp. Marseille-Q5471 TaxID=3039493 RepID=UPI0024BCAE8C|nr:hypothetical protein [Butyricicoccus sp. Marseille-Q5471]
MDDRPILIAVTDKQKITCKTHAQFWFAYQKSILLAIKEKGTLDEMQYRRAEKKLEIQFYAGLKEMQEADTLRDKF